MQYLSLGIGIILSISSFSALADDSNQSGLGAAFGVGAGGGILNQENIRGHQPVVGRIQSVSRPISKSVHL